MRLFAKAVAAATLLFACGGSDESGLFSDSDASSSGRDGGTTTGGGSSTDSGMSASGGSNGSGGRSSGGNGSGGDVTLPDGSSAGGTVGDASANDGSSSGGADSSTPGSGGRTEDAGPDGEPTPGTIACGTSSCTIAGLPTNICCIEGLTTQCLPSFPGCANFGRPIACDDSADCDGGEMCCGALATAARCSASCGDGQVQLCRTTSECASGVCRPHPTRPQYSTCQ